MIASVSTDSYAGGGTSPNRPPSAFVPFAPQDPGPLGLLIERVCDHPGQIAFIADELLVDRVVSGPRLILSRPDPVGFVVHYAFS